MLVKPIKLPEVNYLYPRPSNEMTVTAVHGEAQYPWLCEMGLSKMKDKIITLQAWLPPKSETVIHRDLNPQGLPMPWTILFCPSGHYGLMLKLYEAIDESKTGVQGAPSKKHGVPTIDVSNARMIEGAYFDKDAAFVFAPGTYYHSVENPTDRWINAISLRANSLSTLGELEGLLAK